MENIVETQALAKSEVINMLKQREITPTQQRVEIAQILFSKPQHLSADQVLAIVNNEGPVASKATIYNTLGLFAKKGLIREVIVDPSKVFYDSNVSEHHHFYDMDNGELIDIDEDAIQLNQLPELPTGTVAEGIDVIIRVRKQSA